MTLKPSNRICWAITPGFEEQLVKFKPLARKVAKRQKMGDVHDLRVVTRRLRVALWLIRQSASIKVPAKTRSSLRKLGRSLGERRQLDVAIRDAKYYKLNDSKLGPLHKKSSTSLSAFLTSKKIDALAKSLGKIHQALLCYATINFTRPMQTLRRNLNTWPKHPTRKTDLHEFRIQAKKTLYAFEMFGQPALPLTRIKDCLGRAHDLEALGKYFKKATKLRSEEAIEIEKSRKLFKPALAFARKKFLEFDPQVEQSSS